MDHENRSGFLSYLLLLACFFAGLFLLDVVFGVHYNPEEHVPHRPHEPVHEGAAENPEVATGEAVEIVPVEPKPVTETGPAMSGMDGLTYYRQLKTRYEEEVLSRLPKHKSRTDIVIRYYHHAPDGNSAYALSKLGYYIHERPVAPQYENFQSNAIYYGDSVKLEDVQLVAFTLLNEGLPIKEVKSSRYSGSWKAKSIEIGTDTTLVDRTTLTYTQVKDLRL